MTQFARGLGMPDWGFGVMAAIPAVATLAQLPGAYVGQRYGWRRGLFIWSVASGRAMWVAIALIPWVVPGGREAGWWWPTMLGLLLVSWVLTHAAGPAWMNWMGDLIPRRVRGRYFARRNLATRPVAFLAVLGIGWLLDAGGRGGGEGGEGMLRITSGVLAIGGLLGTLDILCFRFVPDPRPPVADRGARLMDVFRTAGRLPGLKNYLAFNFTFVLGIGFVGQYVWLYVLDECGWSNSKANLLVIAVPLAVQAVTVGLWGRVIDRVGKKPVLILAGCVVSFGSVGWLFITPERMALGYTLVLAVVLFWPAIEMANFNMLLDFADDPTLKRADRRSAAGAAVAVNAVVTAVAGTVSGLLGGLLAAWLRDLHAVVPVVGVVLTYHGVLFLISGLLRAVSLVFAVRLREPRAAGTRDAVRYATGLVYSNVRQAVFLPTRIVGRVLRASYRAVERR